MRLKQWWLLWMLRLCLVLTLCVIALGAYTRLSDAGLGCPDWPGCYGHLSVPDTASELKQVKSHFPDLTVEPEKAWAEMIHRYFAGGLGLMVFAISWLTYGSPKTGKILPLSLTLLIIGQALLGMWTVTLQLMPIIVLAHLFGGFTLLALLLILYTKINSPTLTFTHSPIIKLTAFSSLIMLIVQIFLGGWTSANYAALMCTSLPICQGNWTDYLDFTTAFTLLQDSQGSYEFGVLEYPARMTIHVSHRIGAIMTTLIVLSLCWSLLQSSHLYFRKQALLIGILLAIQITLGINNVLLQLPLSNAVLHNLVGALLLVSVVRLNYLLAAAQQTAKNLKTTVTEDKSGGIYE